MLYLFIPKNMHDMVHGRMPADLHKQMEWREETSQFIHTNEEEMHHTTEHTLQIQYSHYTSREVMNSKLDSCSISHRSYGSNTHISSV